jgi:hypothetical protein
MVERVENLRLSRYPKLFRLKLPSYCSRKDRIKQE